MGQFKYTWVLPAGLCYGPRGRSRRAASTRRRSVEAQSVNFGQQSLACHNVPADQSLRGSGHRAVVARVSVNTTIDRPLHPFLFRMVSNNLTQTDTFTFRACWVIVGCFHNPPNSDMGYRIFNVRACVFFWGLCRVCTEFTPEKSQGGRKA